MKAGKKYIYLEKIKEFPLSSLFSIRGRFSTSRKLIVTYIICDSNNFKNMKNLNAHSNPEL